MSQVGYMFLALGAGAWTAALFHLLTHAFFKALLFLSAGVVIGSLHEEHDVFRMGGLRRTLPLAFWTFLAGAASLAALPFVTAGFYSKDAILLGAWLSPKGGAWLWAAGIAGAFLTSLYAFRMVFLVFFGPPPEDRALEVRRPTPLLSAPLWILAALSLAGGFVDLPHGLGGTGTLSRFLERALPHSAPVSTDAGPSEAVLSAIAAGASLGGIALAALLYLGRRRALGALARSGAMRAARGFFGSGFGFDRLYAALFEAPFGRLARANSADLADALYRGIAATAVRGNALLSWTQSGKVRWYAAGIVVGGILILGAVLVL
jgi:NADH-quinone oxidoreductase subunit L